MDLGRRALSSTCSRNALPTKLHQPATNITYKRLMGPDDRQKAGGQLELPVERHVVAPVDGGISPNIAHPTEHTHQLDSCLYTVYLSLVFGSCSRSYLTSVGFWVVQSVSERFSVNFVTGINRPYIGMYYKRGMYCSIANQCIGELVSLSETKIVPAALSIAVRRTFRGPPGTMQ